MQCPVAATRPYQLRSDGSVGGVGDGLHLWESVTMLGSPGILMAGYYGMPLVLLFRNYRYLQIFEDISHMGISHMGI